jgi:predicted GIY-YIG superfamily endonuclease
MSRPAYVYRACDETGDLIYVGCTVDLSKRIDQHHMGAWWAYQIARVSARVYPDKQTALAHEAAAIATEIPRWNRTGRRPRHLWTRAEYHDHIVSGIAGHALWHQSRFWQDESDEYMERFGEPLPLDDLIALAEAHLERARQHQSAYRQHVTAARQSQRLARVLAFPAAVSA